MVHIDIMVSKKVKENRGGGTLEFDRSLSQGRVR